MSIKAKEIKLVPLSEIKLNPKNRNKHPQDQIDRLVEIINYQGFRRPVTISTLSGFLSCGEGRFIAAKKIGLKEIPAMYQDYESAEQEYADGIADNAIDKWAELDLTSIQNDLSELDALNIDFLGIKNFTLDEPFEAQADEDEVPEHVEPKSKLGDIYQLGNHRLMCGDSTSIDSVEKLMDGVTAELCFTSPPYSDQREYNGEKELSTKHLATFIRSSVNNVKLYAVNLGLSRKENEINQYWDDYIEEAKSCELKFLSWNVWNRQGSGFSVGNATAMFPIEHEFIFVFGERKEVNKIIPNKSAGRVDKHTTNRQADGSTTKAHTKVVSDKRALGTVIHLNMEMDRSFKHPAMFPVAFPETYIEALTSIGDHVFEPFGGSGTTAIACEKTNRKCFMMELDCYYVSVIIERWMKFTGKMAYLIKEDGTQVAWSDLDAKR